MLITEFLHTLFNKVRFYKNRIFQGLIKIPQWYWFFIKLRPFASKYVFLFLCIIGLMWHAVYTNYIISRLQKNAELSTDTYAKFISAAVFDKLDPESEEFVLGTVPHRVDMPFIITTTTWEPVLWRNIEIGPFYARREINQNDDDFENKRIIKRKIDEFRKIYEPKIIYGKDRKTKVLYLVYGKSKLLSSLSWMPIIEALFIVIFFLFVYFALHNIMMTERSNLWVGLAKETAHQLGTPISSLLGWVEYIRTIHEADEHVEPEIFMQQLHGICDDMHKDITRLQRIASRFSQIGSKPTLVYNDLNEAVTDNIKYFRTRLPMLTKHIEIETKFGNIPKIAFNRDLLDWVLENLFKNSVDAIEQTNGLIQVHTEYISSEKMARILHIDNGKGIPWEHQKNVFSPGYTTKKRGWGLGLTLAKRIIEDYHNGRIYISWSQKNKGTAFSIELPTRV